MKQVGPIKVLVVDDSPLVRVTLTRELGRHEDLQVVGGAKDPYEARELILASHPDVIILDTDMPRMDGLAFLKRLQAHYPVPVIMCSDPSPEGSRAALEAVECGAVDVVAKPGGHNREALRRLGGLLAEKIRAAAVAMPRPSPLAPAAARPPATFRAAGLDPQRYLIALGASTGGTEAIRKVLERLPPDFPPLAMVQHMPAGFTGAFAARLDGLSRITVGEATGGDALTPGHAFLARGGQQMIAHGTPGHWRLAYDGDQPVNLHCPSVDVLFHSVARTAGRQAVGILLTGMGADGARGLLAMHQAGAITLAQSRESCVVFGMPKVAIELGAADHVAPVEDLPRLIVQSLRQREQRNARGRVPANS